MKVWRYRTRVPPRRYHEADLCHSPAELQVYRFDRRPLSLCQPWQWYAFKVTTWPTVERVEPVLQQDISAKSTLLHRTKFLELEELEVRGNLTCSARPRPATR